MPARKAQGYVMAYVTVPDRAVAHRIARAVLEKRLAACANLAPIESFYWWQGEIENAGEVLLILKTRRALVPRLTEAIRAEHPYEVPCIVTYPMESGLDVYLGWIAEETRAQRKIARAP